MLRIIYNVAHDHPPKPLFLKDNIMPIHDVHTYRLISTYATQLKNNISFTAQLSSLHRSNITYYTTPIFGTCIHSEQVMDSACTFQCLFLKKKKKSADVFRRLFLYFEKSVFSGQLHTENAKSVDEKKNSLRLEKGDRSTVLPQWCALNTQVVAVAGLLALLVCTYQQSCGSSAQL